MRNLVLGSEGFIGRNFCEYLRKHNEEVVGIDIKNGPKEDLRNCVIPLTKIDRVYFLAWDIGGFKYQHSKSAHLAQLKNNTRIVSNVFSQLEKFKKPIIFASTQLVADKDNPYSITKLLGEMWTTEIGGASLRLWNAYGVPAKSSERSYAITDFVYQALTSRKIQMLSKGNETRQFVFIDDVCTALRSAAIQGVKGVYQITSNVNTPIKEVARLIAENTLSILEEGDKEGYSFKPIEVTPLPNWSPSVDITTGIKKTIEASESFLKYER